LDLYTIYRELGKLDGLTISLLGDLKYGRTVHSLLKFFSFFKDLNVNLVCPKSLMFPEDLLKEIQLDSIKINHFTYLMMT